MVKLEIVSNLFPSKIISDKKKHFEVKSLPVLQNKNIFFFLQILDLKNNFLELVYFYNNLCNSSCLTFLLFAFAEIENRELVWGLQTSCNLSLSLSLAVWLRHRQTESHIFHCQLEILLIIKWFVYYQWVVNE